MKIEEFISKIEAEFEEIEKGILEPQSIYKDFIHWSSMNSLILIILIESEYNVLLNDNDFSKSSTVEDLFNIVQERINSKD